MSAIRSTMQIARQLAGVKRFSRDFSFCQESVLEHTGFVAMYAFAVAKEIQERKLHQAINYQLLMGKALMHDAEEGSMGDIPRTTKYMSPEITAALKSAENKVAEKVLGPIGMLGYWQASKSNGIEGDIIALADLAAVVYQTVNELYVLGNSGYKNVLQEVEEFIAERVDRSKDSVLLPFYEQLKTILMQGQI